MTAALAVSDLDVAYGRAQALFGVSLNVPRGGAVALLGRNGAGKSTTLKAVIGLAPPSGGSVRVLDAASAPRDVAGWPAHRIAALGVGYVPEDRRIFSRLSVLENLEVGRRRGPGPAWSVDDLFALFPNLAERRAAPGGALSGGEQQMLAIARTLMGAPSLLLLDEPSEGVAPTIVRALAEAVRAVRAEGLSLLVSEQNARFAESVTDAVVILETGSVGYEGPWSALSDATREKLLAV